MAVIHDSEFGAITIRRSHLSKSVRLSVAPNGSLRVSMPTYAPLFLAKRLVAISRGSIRELLEPKDRVVYENGQQIGKSHSLEIIRSPNRSVTRRAQRIVVSVPSEDELYAPEMQRDIRDAVIKALRREASSYLPKRLAYLARLHGYTYKKVRFSHASSRWGSCSSSGTISLNIALMRLPFELIDYVLLHELCHTKEMNHSSSFWELVAEADPEFKHHRTSLKSENPMVL